MMETINIERKYNNQGYILVFVNDEWRLEHNYVVERFIGRRLRKNEVVHHIDGNKSNNRISNLFLFKNQKLHKSFENKIKQFKLTNPIIRQINNRWNQYE